MRLAGSCAMRVHTCPRRRPCRPSCAPGPTRAAARCNRRCARWTWPRDRIATASSRCAWAASNSLAGNEQEAIRLFQSVIQDYPRTPLAAEAQFRIGFDVRDRSPRTSTARSSRVLEGEGAGRQARRSRRRRSSGTDNLVRLRTLPHRDRLGFAGSPVRGEASWSPSTSCSTSTAPSARSRSTGSDRRLQRGTPR